MKVTGSSIQQLDKKRPNGDALPKSECRHWRLWATTEQGRKSKRFGGTYTQAQNALRAFVAELEGLVPNPETFACYAESWRLWREKSGTLAAGTCENDRREVRALLRTELAGMRMDEITPQDCREALLWLKTHPVRKQGELSNTTMNKIHICLNSILKQAADDERIARNPMAKIKTPKPDTKEKEALAPMELGLLLNRLGSLPLDGRTMAVYLMASLGLRRSEACAISNTDISNGMARIHLAVKERTGEIAEPKTPSGIRTVPCSGQLMEKVEEWRAVRKRKGWENSPTLCCNTKGGILRPQLLQRWWSGDSYHTGVRDSIGCAGMTLHQLRHSNLSMMARHMSPFDLKHYAGWASIEPAKVYIHDDLEAVKRGVDSAWDSIVCTISAPIETGQKD